ncbi:PLDc N-terminal domain-containing protein [Aliiglaciecola sp. 3_MG-2023]|uniref:PLDc N-terminal domain-containing protein n=1 Tax=Aliiglaciecola sp. 3_MG-2023 TaxID=3062644 RepID=UPI0034A5A595
MWVLPIRLIFKSDKTTGKKLAWVLAIVFISWLAWIFYLLLAQIQTITKDVVLLHDIFNVKDVLKSVLLVFVGFNKVK